MINTFTRLDNDKVTVSKTKISRVPNIAQFEFENKIILVVYKIATRPKRLVVISKCKGTN